MVVMKFGGTSIADSQPIVRVASIVGRQAGDRVVVVSALAGVTDRLAQVGALARSGRADAARGVIDGLVRRHRAVAAALAMPPASTSELSDYLDTLRDDVTSLVARAAGDEHTETWVLDAILAAGELMASRLVAHAFEALGIQAAWVDPRQLLVTDSAHGAATVEHPATAERLERQVRPLVGRGRVPVIGGFVGASHDGRTTTLGRGGSDVTAAVLGILLGAAEIQIWTDVDGVLAADPRVVRQPRHVPRLSFAEARELAFLGAKVLHPGTLDVAAVRRVPVRVLNSRRPEADGTLVAGASGPQQIPVALACRRDLSVLTMTPRSVTPQALLEDALGLLQRCSPQPVVAVTIDGCVVAAFDDRHVAADFAASVQDVADLRMHGDCAVLAAVAETIATSPSAADDVVATLDGLTVHALARTPSTHAVIAILDDADLPDAMARLHDKYGGSVRADAPSDGTASSDDPALAGAPS
jgi:aspartate kinase